jgi:hypothetical protein
MTEVYFEKMVYFRYFRPMDEDKITTADKNVMDATTDTLAQEIADLKQTIKGYDTQLKAAINTIMKPRRRIMPSSPLVAKTTTGCTEFIFVAGE